MRHTFYRKTVALEVQANNDGIFITMAERPQGQDRFDWQNALRFALGVEEAGSIIAALRQRHPVNFFHSPAGDRTKPGKRLRLEPTVQDTEEGKRVLYVVRLNDAATERSLALTLDAGEATVLDLFLVRALWMQFDANDRFGQRQQSSPAQPPVSEPEQPYEDFPF